MSLLDAFVPDPAPFEVWVAYRTDGIASEELGNNAAVCLRAATTRVTDPMPAVMEQRVGQLPRRGIGTASCMKPCIAR